MNYLILVRHGQSIWNLEKKFTGWVDVDLNENGKNEAKKAAKLIKEKDINIDLYYSSLQLRAKNTLTIIQEELMDYKNVKPAWQLNERHYGSLTGLNKELNVAAITKYAVTNAKAKIKYISFVVSFNSSLFPFQVI